MRTNFLLALVVLVGGSAMAEEWGDTSYTQPSASSSDAQVEQIPASIADDSDTVAEADTSTNSSLVSEDLLSNANEETYASEEHADVAEEKSVEEKPARAEREVSRSSVTNISTVRNTYGVETEEKPGLKLYVSPFAGISSVMGNTTADATPQYAAGASIGLLISRSMMLEASYTYAEQNLSNPRYNTTSGIMMGTGVPNVFSLKTNAFDAGVKLFFLGRESRFRPYFGGGMGYTKSYLNYTSSYQQVLGYQSQYVNDYVTNQVTGFGQLGAEFAITKAIVVNAAFKLAGIFSSDTTAATTNLDASKLEVGNSLSRTASYTVAAGVGIYF